MSRSAEPATAGSRAAKPIVAVTDLGRTPYERAWDIQHRLVEERKAGAGVDALLLVEHDPVITMGRRARPEHVLAGQGLLARRGVRVYAVERGGDVTYHGPGQLVAYPVLDLHDHRRNVRWFASSLLHVIVRTVARFGIEAVPGDGPETGVWVTDGLGRAKLASLGVRIERWVTYHGIALNVNTNLDDFAWIVPCGLAGARMTSMARLLRTPVSLAEVQAAFVAEFAEVFGVAVRSLTVAQLTAHVNRLPPWERSS